MKKIKVLKPATDHDVRHGKCAACGRTGADLVAKCPGYRTAAEAGARAIQAGPTPKQGAKRQTTAVIKHTKKGARR